MKFRKSLIAAAAALSVSAGVITAAPAMAADESSTDSITSSFGSSGSEPAVETYTCYRDTETKKVVSDPANYDGTVEKAECLRKVKKSKQFMNDLKDIVALIGTIASFFAAIMSLNNNADKLIKSFAR